MAGEGSRGGQVVGHTPRGKPVYASDAERKAALNAQPDPPRLVEDHPRYFTPHAQARVIPLDQLHPTKSVEQEHAESEGQSIARAAKSMHNAYHGVGDKRAPITVRPRPEGGFHIVDGNATYHAAVRHGWSSLPAVHEGVLAKSARWLLAKAEQLMLFGRPSVQRPGSRGGKYRVTPKGEVRYDAAPTEPPEGAHVIAWREEPGRNGRKGTSAWYVASLPGEGGVDWGYTDEPGKAKPLSVYWWRRFRANSERVGRTPRFRVVDAPKPEPAAPPVTVNKLLDIGGRVRTELGETKHACRAGTEKLVAALQAAGVPAREVYGYVWVDGDDDGGGEPWLADHHWAEVGDLVVDITGDQFNPMFRDGTVIPSVLVAKRSTLGRYLTPNDDMNADDPGPFRGTRMLGGTDQPRDPRREHFLALARRDFQHEEWAYHGSFSGTDMAEAPFSGLRRKFWLAMAEGGDFDAAFQAFDTAWRQYAAENNAKVAAAPKIRMGPREGQSSMEHRWVSPDKARDDLPFLHRMVAQGDAILKAEQLLLFGNGREPVKRPGIRGGRYRITPRGAVRYDEAPAPVSKVDAPTRDTPPAAPAAEVPAPEAKPDPSLIVPQSVAEHMAAWLEKTYGADPTIRDEMGATLRAFVEQYPDAPDKLGGWTDVLRAAIAWEQNEQRRFEEKKRADAWEQRKAAFAGTPAGGGEDDIPLDVAMAAHSGTSMVPEQRAAAVRREYAQQLMSDYEALAKHATTPEKKALLDAEFATYRAGMREHMLAYLRSRSGVVSAYIAGPSKFNFRRQEKRQASERRRFEEFDAWQKKARGAIQAKLTPEDQPIRAEATDAVERLEQEIAKAEKLQEQMRAANAAIRKHAKAGRDAQVAALVALGFSEGLSRKVLEPDFAGRIGFAPYMLTNNQANIRRMQARLVTVREAKATPGQEVQGEHGIRLEDDPAGNRVRLFFPGKPDEQTRARLKHHGFRWAPSIGAWQAYRNARAMNAAEAEAGVKLAKSSLLVFLKGRFPDAAPPKGKHQLGATRSGREVWASGAEAGDYDDDDHQDAAMLHARAAAYHEARATSHGEAATSEKDWRRSEEHHAERARHEKLHAHHFDRVREHLVAAGKAEEATFDGQQLTNRKPVGAKQREAARKALASRTHHDHPGGIDDADREAYEGREHGDARDDDLDRD